MSLHPSALYGTGSLWPGSPGPPTPSWVQWQNNFPHAHYRAKKVVSVAAPGQGTETLASVTWLTGEPPKMRLGQPGSGGSRWVTVGGTHDTQGGHEDWCTGSREHTAEPGGRGPMCPHLESCFQGLPPHPQRQSARERGPGRAVT